MKNENEIQKRILGLISTTLFGYGLYRINVTLMVFFMAFIFAFACLMLLPSQPKNNSGL